MWIIYITTAAYLIHNYLYYVQMFYFKFLYLFAAGPFFGAFLSCVPCDNKKIILQLMLIAHTYP